MNTIKLYTIGYCKKNAQTFFDLISDNNIRKVIDIRLNNSSQLAGFSKNQDINYFLDRICDCKYEHIANWAPTKEILDAYKKKKINWENYEKQFQALLIKRHIEKNISLNNLDKVCLLCSEPTADKCHRRLVAEYIQSHMDNVEIIHL